LPAANEIPWNALTTDQTGALDVRHATENEIRVHDVPLSIYVAAHKRVFFEPRAGTFALYQRFNERVKGLINEWWDRIENSRVFAANIEAIRHYHRTLRPGSVSLVGLIAEGGQGMRTANNARFLAYLEGTRQARELEEQAVEWSSAWLADRAIAPVYRQLVSAPAATQTIRHASALHGNQPFIDCENNSMPNSLALAARHCFESLREI
jgi:hypothetical protein